MMKKSEITKNEMIMKLLKLPNEIDDVRKEICRANQEILVRQDRVSRWEIGEMEDINENKAIFTNAEKRKAELEKRKQEDIEISEILGKIKSLKETVEIKKLYLSFLVDTQENLRAIARLGGGI